MFDEFKCLTYSIIYIWVSSFYAGSKLAKKGIRFRVSSVHLVIVHHLPSDSDLLGLNIDMDLAKTRGAGLEVLDSPIPLGFSRALSITILGSTYAARGGART